MPHGHIGRSMGPPVIHTPSLLCVAPLVRYCRYHHAAWEGPAGPDTLCHQPGSYCGPWPPSAELVPETATNDNCCPTCWSLACQCLVASLVAISHPCMCGARRPAQASASPQTIEDFDFTFTAPEGGFRSGWTGRAELLTGGRVLGESLSSMGFGQWAWRLGAWVPGSIGLLGDRGIGA